LAAAGVDAAVRVNLCCALLQVLCRGLGHGRCL
jgi:hypothetical protein